ncbi:hypothetical protein BDN70DRAFT_928067 [Pholiota conissans]|uniref:Flavin reductase like domain-containing protein n=1 Tax=Pholiota conissans TaxID=109636 RepID=A0A9P6CY42_9AGAR|nr:hypothetical protein BDN70DRAFT_928067 [Pholiota conissans]
MAAPQRSSLPPFSPTTEFKFSKSPNSGWQYGQRIETTPDGQAWMEREEDGWTVIDTSKEDAKKIYNIMSSGIIPRPIGFVSSISEDGYENLAPFSWFNQACLDPPIITVACSNNSRPTKDTARNIKSTKGFTVNIISEPWIEQANMASIDTPYGVSEWPLTGLTKAPSIHVKAARVKESAFVLECELYQDVEIKHPKTDGVVSTLILGLVKYIHMRNDIIEPTKGTVDPGKLRAVGRLGGVTYSTVAGGFTIERPTWKDYGAQLGEDGTTRIDTSTS